LSENQKYIIILKYEIQMRQADAAERARRARRPARTSGEQATRLQRITPGKPDNGAPNRAGDPFDDGLSLTRIAAIGPLLRQPFAQGHASGRKRPLSPKFPPQLKPCPAALVI
jgi:hypothetical protein